MFFFFAHTYCPMACIKWVLPRPTPPYTKRGLYVRAGACATARLAACAISLFGPTTKDSHVFRGLSAADNRCHSCAHLLSIANLLTVLHKCHSGRDHGKLLRKTGVRWSYFLT